MRVSASPHPRQHLFSSVVLIVAIVVGMKQGLYGLFDTSLMTNDAEHLFMCLFAICILSLKKCPLPISILGYLSFYCILRILHTFWILSPLSDT